MSMSAPTPGTSLSSLARACAMSVPRTSLALSRASITARLGPDAPPRRRTRSSSSARVRVAIRSNPSMLLLPLSVCAARKIEFRHSRSPGARSRPRTPSSNVRRSSSASSKKICRTGSRVTPAPSRTLCVRAGRAEDSRHHLTELLGLERLDEPAGGPRGPPALLHLLTVLGREQQHGGELVLRALADGAEQGQPVHGRHIEG